MAKVPLFANVTEKTADYIAKQKKEHGIGKGVHIDLAIAFYRKFKDIPEEKLAKLMK